MSTNKLYKNKLAEFTLEFTLWAEVHLRRSLSTRARAKILPEKVDVDCGKGKCGDSGQGNMKT